MTELDAGIAGNSVGKNNNKKEPIPSKSYQEQLEMHSLCFWVDSRFVHMPLMERRLKTRKYINTCTS